MSEYPIPIRPRAEQRRIVAKVDELIALVDTLENQLATAHSTAEKLMEAVVTELTVRGRVIPVASQSYVGSDARSETGVSEAGQLNSLTLKRTKATVFLKG